MLFLAGFLLLVVFGAKTYKGSVDSQAADDQNRALMGYFATCVSANDNNGAVYISEGEYGHVLEIPDQNTGYGLRIYCFEGQLMEAYMNLDGQIVPENDICIGKTQTFNLEFIKDDTLKITTDEGSVIIRMRSEGSGRSS